MRKIIKLTRNELVEQIRKSITKNINEVDYTADVERGTQPREFQVKDILVQHIQDIFLMTLFVT